MNGRHKTGTTHIGQVFLRVFGPAARSYWGPCPFPPPGRLQPKGGVRGFPSPTCRPRKHLPAPGWGPDGCPHAAPAAAPWGWPTAAGGGCGGAGWHWDGRTAERGNRWKLDGGERKEGWEKASRPFRRPLPPSRLRGLASSSISNMGVSAPWFHPSTASLRREEDGEGGFPGEAASNLKADNGSADPTTKGSDVPQFPILQANAVC